MEYRRVISRLFRPNSSITVFKSTPTITKCKATLYPKSWKWKLSITEFSISFSKDFGRNGKYCAPHPPLEWAISCPKKGIEPKRLGHGRMSKGDYLQRSDRPRGGLPSKLSFLSPPIILRDGSRSIVPFPRNNTPHTARRVLDISLTPRSPCCLKLRLHFPELNVIICRKALQSSLQNSCFSKLLDRNANGSRYFPSGKHSTQPTGRHSGHKTLAEDMPCDHPH